MLRLSSENFLATAVPISCYSFHFIYSFMYNIDFSNTGILDTPVPIKYIGAHMNNIIYCMILLMLYMYRYILYFLHELLNVFRLKGNFRLFMMYFSKGLIYTMYVHRWCKCIINNTKARQQERKSIIRSTRQ